MIEVRQCDAGHLSLDAANWECPWCEVERLRTEMHDCSDRDTRAFASLQAQAHRQHERGEKAEKQTEIWRSAHDRLRQDRDEWRSASQMHEAEVERLTTTVAHLSKRASEYEADRDRNAALCMDARADADRLRDALRECQRIFDHPAFTDRAGIGDVVRAALRGGGE